MTRHESFKRRIRERMLETGERYVAARRVLLDRARGSQGRTWISEPELSDDSVRRATGRGWDEWSDILDRRPAGVEDHGAMAAHLRDEFGVDGWWAQTVVVGYERITGLRRKYQRPDGSFSAGKSRTVSADADALRQMLLDADDRRDIFPGLETELRSKPTSKAIRLRIGPGVAQIAMDRQEDGRTRISIAHERLPDAEDVELWKTFWTEWLQAVDGD